MATARDILETYWNQKFPIDPVILAEQWGAKVIPDADLEGDISGQFFYEDKVPVIRYNPEKHRLRQRFTIAHELGHYALGHPGGYRDDIKNLFGNSSDIYEQQANHFAAELLMPEEYVHLLIRHMDPPTVTGLAKEFDVSEKAMHFRLKNLGIV